MDQSVAKKPWESKTIVLNTLMALVASAAVFYPHASVVTDFINAHATEIGVLWSVANIILRSVTKNAIALTD